MSTAPCETADHVIDALLATAADTRPFVAALPDADLTAQSGAAEWTVADALSHLGSGAQVWLAQLESGLRGEVAPDDLGPPIWAHWDALTPEQKRSEFLEATGVLLDRVAALDADTRASVRVRLSYLPEPVDLTTFTLMRLSEVALHSWDVRVAYDPAAALFPAAVEALIDWAPPFFSYYAKHEVIDREVTLILDLTDPVRTKAVHIGASSGIVDPTNTADGLLHMPAEAWLRLVGGRLSAAHTPADVALDADGLTLEDLRRVFPGY